MNALTNFLASIRNRNDEGQDLLEYALLVALIAIVAVARGHSCRQAGQCAVRRHRCGNLVAPGPGAPAWPDAPGAVAHVQHGG